MLIRSTTSQSRKLIDCRIKLRHLELNIVPFTHMRWICLGYGANLLGDIAFRVRIKLESLHKKFPIGVFPFFTMYMAQVDPEF